MLSDEGAEAGFFLLDDGLGFGLEDHPHGLIKDLLESLLGERTTLHVLALELLFDDFTSCVLGDGSLFGVFLLGSILIPQVYLVPDEDFGDVGDAFLQLRVPLN